jgi:hypothetical protein
MSNTHTVDERWMVGGRGIIVNEQNGSFSRA